jgi:hypothetical protein
MIMSLEAYNELRHDFVMPLPIPKPPSAAGMRELHYLIFKEAVQHSFTNEHQLSLLSRRRDDNSVVVGNVIVGGQETRSTTEHMKYKLLQGKFISGHVSWKDCMKPRCLSSVDAPSRMKPRVGVEGEEPTIDALRVCREYATTK